MINFTGWKQFSVWENSQSVLELYRNRCVKIEPEMTCSAQAACLISENSEENDTLLDVGCGSGYFYHSLISRNINVDYWGIDASEKLINIGKDELPKYGLNKNHLLHGRIEDMCAKVDHTVCLNVLTNIDNYHRPLERILLSTNKSLILRESLSNSTKYKYVYDNYIDESNKIKVHVNTYSIAEIVKFIEGYDFTVRTVKDIRTGDRPELVIGYQHFWKFIVATRN